MNAGAWGVFSASGGRVRGHRPRPAGDSMGAIRRLRGDVSAVLIGDLPHPSS